MKIIDRASEIYREQYLARMKRLNATGWDTATLANVAHLEIDDPKLACLALAIEEAIAAGKVTP